MKKLTILIAILLPWRALAETWAFQTPPSPTKSMSVDADWRPYGALALNVRLDGQPPRGQLLCTVFLQTKQDLWFVSRQALALNGKRQTFELRLDDDSPDWQCANGRRAFGVDALRWVRAWGVQIFSDEPYAGRLEVGEPQFQPAAPGRIEMLDVRLPETAKAGCVNPVRFTLAGFGGNPCNSSEIAARLVWTESGRPCSTPFYLRQEYVAIRRPGTGEDLAQPLERPFWRADWTPARAGETPLRIEVNMADLKMARDCGRIKVEPPSPGQPGSLPLSDGPAGGFSAFAELMPVGRDDDARVSRYQSGHWVQPATPAPIDRYWAVPLDWTPKWGHYTGAGEFDPRLAWRFEQGLKAAEGEMASPILLFSDDDLDNNGVFNWVDHPLNAANGGRLKRASDYFSDPEALRITLDRARYMWARYGGSGAVSGLLLRVGRGEEEAVRWVNRIAAELAREFPDLRVFSDNPELPDRRRMPLVVARWKTDPRLGAATGVATDAAQKQVIVTGRYPGSSAILSREAQHLAGVSLLACDVFAPADAGDAMSALCFVRTEPDTVFQSAAQPLRGGDWKRLYFPLDRPEAWRCLQDARRVLRPYDVLNVSELGFRFFCATNAAGPVRVRNCAANWPYEADREREPALAIGEVKGARGEVPQYSKLELDFPINRVFGNPYDPDEIAVSIELAGPDGKRVSHPGYFNEPWALETADGVETAVRAGEPSWRVRYTPSRLGKYTWEVVAQTPRERAAVSGSFVCVPGMSRGFVRVSQRDPRYFECDDGSFCYLVGHNLRSPSDRRPSAYIAEAAENADWADERGTGAYAKWFDALRANGANFARIWMCPWWCGLEWNDQTPGYHGLDYYNQGNAARLDRLLELAEKDGIYVNLETINHGTLSTRTDPDWEHNPLNRYTQPGGYLEYATDFFSSRRALQGHRNKLRYTVARWGYSPAIAWWGVITEAEWAEPYTRSLPELSDAIKWNLMPWIPRPYATGRYREAYNQWISDTGGYIRGLDAHAHPVSVHFSNPAHGLEVWRLPNTDVVHNNAYTTFSKFWEPELFTRSRGVADMVYVYSEFYEPYRRRKPLIIGEWGGDPGVNEKNQLIAEMHTGTWAILMTGMSGVTGYWWWNLVDALDLYQNYKGVAAFMNGEDRRGKQYRSSRASLEFPRSSTGWRRSHRDGLVLSNASELFAYVYAWSVNDPFRSRVARSFDDPSFPACGDGMLSVPDDLQDGRYRLECWNTFTGEIIATKEVVLSQSSRTIPVMSHRVDLALKLKPVVRR